MNVFLRIGQAMPHISHANTTYISNPDDAIPHHKKSHVCRRRSAAFHARGTCQRGNLFPSIQSLRNLNLCSYRFPKRLIPSLLFFAILFTIVVQVSAHEDPYDTTTNGFQPLQIGDPIPDEVWDMPLQVVNHPDGKETITLRDYKEKLIILDFWATWCAACISMFPKMDSLQAGFGDKLQILSVTTESTKTINLFFDRLNKDKESALKFLSIVGDSLLTEIFPHTFLPHYVWIGKNGKVISFTEQTAITEDAINLAYTSNIVNSPIKNDVVLTDIDYDRPLYENPVLANTMPVYSSKIWKGYAKGLIGGYRYSLDTKDQLYGSKVTCTNQPIANLFIIANNQGYRLFELDVNVQINVKDYDKVITDKFGMEYEQWLEDNGYSYELIVPIEQKDSLFAFMRQDLKRLFPQYKSEIKEEKTRALVLTVTDTTRLIKSKENQGEIIEINKLGIRAKNVTLAKLVTRLNQDNVFQLPVTNKTGYHRKIDLQFTADMNNLDKINEQLEKYGLKLIDGHRTKRLLIISDNI